LPIETQAFLSLGQGTSLHTFQDEAMVAPRYNGLGSLTEVGYRVERTNRFLQRLMLDFQPAALANQSNAELTNRLQLLVRSELRYSYLRYITRFWDDNLQVHAGARLSTMTSANWRSHLGNSSISYSINAQLAAAGNLRYRVPFSRGPLFLNWRLALPVTGYWVRPTYNNLPNSFQPGSNALEGRLEAGQWSAWHNTFQMDSRLSIIAPFESTGNQLRLSYQWRYYQHTGGHWPVYAGQHAFFFSFLFHL
jgi:hypothetical protein